MERRFVVFWAKRGVTRLFAESRTEPEIRSSLRATTTVELWDFTNRHLVGDLDGQFTRYFSERVKVGNVIDLIAQTVQMEIGYGTKVAVPGFTDGHITRGEI